MQLPQTLKNSARNLSGFHRLPLRLSPILVKVMKMTLLLFNLNTRFTRVS